MKAKKKSSKKLKNKSKPSKVNNSNGTGKPQWKKIKLTGNLLSDEGGTGLEGLLGLEVLENAGDVVSILKEKYVKQKKEKFTENVDFSDEESGSDDEHSNKKKRRKKLQKLKKEKDKEKSPVDNGPGKFVRAMAAGGGEATKKKKKKGKGSKPKKIAESIEASEDEEKITMNDLIVSI